MKRNKLLLITAIAFLFCATTCGLYLYSLRGWESYSPSKYTLDLTAWLLEAVRAQKPMPQQDDLPTDIRFSITQAGLEQCWHVFLETMGRNNNRYTLRTARIIGEYGTPIPSPVGSTEVFAEVIFSDGTLVEVYFYNSTLESCREVTGINKK